MYLSGQYIQQNYDKGMKLLCLAADNDNIEAQFTLGAIFVTEKQKGSNDYNYGINLLEKAACKGHVEAKQILDQIK